MNKLVILALVLLIVLLIISYSQKKEGFQNAPTCSIQFSKYVNYDLPGNDVASATPFSGNYDQNTFNRLDDLAKKECGGSNKCFGYLIGYNNKTKKYHVWYKSTANLSLVRSVEGNKSYSDWRNLTLYLKKDPNKKPSKPNWTGNETTFNGRCGPNHGDMACPGNQCCSAFGWCGGVAGNNDDWCKKFNGFSGRFDAQDPKKVAEERAKIAAAEADAKNKAAQAEAQKKAAEAEAQRKADEAARAKKAAEEADARVRAATDATERARAQALADAQKRALEEAQRQAAAAEADRKRREAVANAAIEAQKRAIAQAEAQKRAIDEATKNAIANANRIIADNQRIAAGLLPAPKKTLTMGPIGPYLYDFYENADQPGNDIRSVTTARSAFNMNTYNSLVLTALNACSSDNKCVGVVTAYDKQSQSYTYYLKNKISANTLIAIDKKTTNTNTNWSGLQISTNGRCGPQNGNKACPGNQCCSVFGWCGGSAGSKDDWCKTYNAAGGRFDGQDPKKVGQASSAYDRFERVDTFIRMPFVEGRTNIGPPQTRVCADVKYNKNIGEFCEGNVPTVNDVNTVCKLKPGYVHDITKCGNLSNVYSEQFIDYENFTNLNNDKVTKILQAYNKIVNRQIPGQKYNRNIDNYKNIVVKIWNKSLEVFYSDPIYSDYGKGYSRITSFNDINKSTFENKLGILLNKLYEICQYKNQAKYTYCTTKPTFYDDLEQLYSTSVVIINQINI
jgi:hypothetical protein